LTITTAEEEEIDFSLIPHYELSSIARIIPQLPLPPEPRPPPENWKKNNATKRRRKARAKKLQLDNIR
jgi:hypothetical protein